MSLADTTLVMDTVIVFDTIQIVETIPVNIQNSSDIKPVWYFQLIGSGVGALLGAIGAFIVAWVMHSKAIKDNLKVSTFKEELRLENIRKLILESINHLIGSVEEVKIALHHLEKQADEKKMINEAEESLMLKSDVYDAIDKEDLFVIFGRDVIKLEFIHKLAKTIRKNDAYHLNTSFQKMFDKYYQQFPYSPVEGEDEKNEKKLNTLEESLFRILEVNIKNALIRCNDLIQHGKDFLELHNYKESDRNYK